MENLKIVKNQLGFTIIEALISASVIGVIAVAVSSQFNFVSKARVASSGSSVVNNLRDKLIIALSNEETCTANLFNVSVTNADIATPIRDSMGNTIVVKNGFYGNSSSAGSSDLKADTVNVQSIATSINPLNAREVLLTVNFAKKSGLTSLFSARETFSMPLNVDTPGGVIGAGSLITKCFSDATFSVATAIRLSCQGNSSYYDPNANPPYGECLHKVQPTILPTACPNGFFMRKVGINLSGAAANTVNSKAFEYECAPLKSLCPVGQVLKSTVGTGVNAGKVVCDWPVPRCAPGQLLVKSAGPNGSFICLQSDIACPGLQAVKRFNADGSVTCAPFYPPSTCSGLFITSITPGSVTCAATVSAINCPFGQFVKSFDANGVPSCASWLNFPQDCAPGWAATGLTAAGNLTCQVMDRNLTCGGNPSVTKTYRDCTAAGGTVNNRANPGEPNAYCIFNGSACPGGWNSCSNLIETANNTCNDTNVNCPQSTTPAAMAPYPRVFNSRGTQIALGTYALTSNSPLTAQCIEYVANQMAPSPCYSGSPWDCTCTANPKAPIQANITKVACY